MLRIQIIGAHYTNSVDSMSDATLAGLARKLIAAGYEDQPYEVYRGDALSMTGKSLQWVADRVLQQEPCLKWRKYVPFDKTVFDS